MPQPEAVVAASSLSAHTLHFAAAAVFLVAGLAAAAMADARESRGERGALRARERSSYGKPLLLACALATVAAAAVHVYVIPEHFGESVLYGTFFVTLAVAQLGWAAVIAVRPNDRLLMAGIAANVSVVLLWLATRLIAVPLGPGAGTREEFGGLDMFATSCELVVIVAAALLLRARLRPRSALVSS